ncbi:MAG: hypothetical protein ACJ0BK_06645 [Coraliomargaritaceae bacterium]
MSHAFFDFIFNSPAYWMAFLALLAASSKLLQLEAARRSVAVGTYCGLQVSALRGLPQSRRSSHIS